jgi:hypothetical protein
MIDFISTAASTAPQVVLPIKLRKRPVFFCKTKGELQIDNDGVSVYLRASQWRLNWNEIAAIQWTGVSFFIRPLGLALVLTPEAIIARADKSRPYSNPTFKPIWDWWGKPLREIGRLMDEAQQASTDRGPIFIG